MACRKLVRRNLPATYSRGGRKWQQFQFIGHNAAVTFSQRHNFQRKTPIRQRFQRRPQHFIIATVQKLSIIEQLFTQQPYCPVAPP